MDNEVVVDTCFLEKMTGEGKHIEDMKRILATLDFKPVVHPYMAKHELSVKSYLKELVDSGYIRVVAWEEFIPDESDRVMYEWYMYEYYEELRLYLHNTNSRKQIKPLNKTEIDSKGTIFDYRYASSSLGDVHMILMAVFMKLPIILTEDSDIAALRSIAKRKIEDDEYIPRIIDSVDLLKLFADRDVSKKDLIRLVRQIGARKRQVEVTKVWDAKNKK